MTDKVQLTPNGIHILHTTKTQQKPPVLLQLLGVVQQSAQESDKQKERVKAIASDGKARCQIIIGGKNMPALKDKLEKNCILRVKDFIANAQANNKKPIIIVIGAEIAAPPQPPIGAPVDYDGKESVVPAASAAPSKPNSTPAKPAAVASTSTPAARNTPAAKTPAVPTKAAPTPSPARKSAAVKPVSEISNDQIIAISSLNPYQQNWVIKARCVLKSDMKHWNKNDKKGTLFSADFQDITGGGIRAVFFNQTAERWYENIKVDTVYIISRGRLKFANKQFNTLSKCDFEISVDDNTVFQESDDDGSINKLTVDYQRLDAFKDTIGEASQDNTTVSVIGVVANLGNETDIQTKAGKPSKVRKIKLVDHVNDQTYAVELSLWGDKAANPPFKEGDVIIGVGLKRSNFGGLSLTTVATSQFLIGNDDVAATLSEWYSSGQYNESDKSVTSYSQRTGKGTGSGGGDPKTRPNYQSLSSIKLQSLGTGAEPDWVNCTATVVGMKDDPDRPMMYPACVTPKPTDKNPNATCNKKCSNETGSWACPNCGNVDTVSYRYICNVFLADDTESLFVTAFDSTAAKMFGLSADQMNSLREDSLEEYEKAKQAIMFKRFNFKLRVQNEVYTKPASDEQATRAKTVIWNIWEWKFSDEAERSLNELKLYVEADQ